MDWLNQHYIEIFGAVSGIIYVFLEIRQNIWLWPLGIVTSALYIWIFYNSGFYADMGLQWYYLFISIYGWILWSKGKSESERERKGEGEKGRVLRQAQEPLDKKILEEGRIIKQLSVSRLGFRTGLVLFAISLILFAGIWLVLERFTDSTIPGWDAFTTALSIVATWMLARKILEHWFIWVLVNIVSVGLYIYKGLFPTVVLFIVYATMAIVGYFEWRKEMRINAN